MEALSITGVICRVANKLVKAARGARQCKRRCQDLARRVEGIDDIVREFEAAPNDSAMRRRVLERLRDALEEALEVVQSCRSFIKLLLPGGSTSSRIDNAERKINNCLLELGVANDVLLGLGNQKNTDAGRLAVHDGVVPRTSTVMNNSGIVMNIKAKHSSVRLKQKSSNTYNISAGRSVNTYFGDSSSGPTRRTAATRITSGLHARRAERCASPPQWRESHKVERAPTVVSINNNSSRVSASAGGSSGHVSVGDMYNGRKQEVTTMPMRGKRWDDRNGRPPGGECIQNQARAAPGPQMLSTTRAASDMYWTPPSQGPEDCQYPYGGAGDHGGVPYYYYHHPSAEEDPNSCSIM